jgi:hypothetical protein
MQQIQTFICVVFSTLSVCDAILFKLYFQVQ